VVDRVRHGDDHLWPRFGEHREEADVVELELRDQLWKGARRTALVMTARNKARKKGLENPSDR
jgi:hypothetical protein